VVERLINNGDRMKGDNMRGCGGERRKRRDRKLPQELEKMLVKILFTCLFLSHGYT
jgi:hypothetical protein